MTTPPDAMGQRDSRFGVHNCERSRAEAVRRIDPVSGTTLVDHFLSPLSESVARLDDA